MKENFPKLFCIYFSVFLNFTNSYGQITRNTLLELENKIPTHWIDSIIRKSKWTLKHRVTLNKSKIISYDSIDNSKNVTEMKFDLSNIEILPFRLIWDITRTNDTIKNLSITYFENEKSFFAFKNFQSKTSGNSIERFPYRIILINEKSMVLEQISDPYYDYETGKILTEQELQKRTQEYYEKNGDNFFGAKVINIGKKKKQVRNWQIYEALF